MRVIIDSLPCAPAADFDAPYPYVAAPYALDSVPEATYTVLRQLLTFDGLEGPDAERLIYDDAAYVAMCTALREAFSCGLIASAMLPCAERFDTVADDVLLPHVVAYFVAP